MARNIDEKSLGLPLAKRKVSGSNPTVMDKAKLWSIDDRQVGAKAEIESSYIAMLIRFWSRKLDGRFKTVLNIPCGLGRHDRVLREEGFDVFSADMDRDFIGIARKRNLPFEKNYSVADMRRLPYPDGRFDVVLNLFTSFGYFNEKGNMKTLEEFSRVLRSGGLLIIDTHNRGPTMETMMPRFVEGMDKGILRLVENHMEGDTWVLKSTLLKDGKRFMTKGSTQTTRVHMYSRKELELMCGRAGLSILAAYGEYTIKLLREGDTRMYLVARKI